MGPVLDLPVASGWMLEHLLDRQDADLRAATDLVVGPFAPESFEPTTSWAAN